MLPGLMVAPGFFSSGGPNIANLFATTLYTGTGSAQTITNGIDFSGLGGLAWIKPRTGANNPHSLQDTVRGRGNVIYTNNTEATNFGGATSAAGTDISTFNSNGFSLGANSNAFVNGSGTTHVAWSFARAARFFDVVTFTTGLSTNRRISHSLGVPPGLIIVKQTSRSSSWWTYHVSRGRSEYLELNSTAASASIADSWGTTDPTSADFGINETVFLNSGESTVAYLFAHDTAGDGVVRCGSYTGNGSASGPTVTLGWQPQWLMMKRTDTTGDWWIYDSARSTSNPRTNKLLANSSAAEDTSGEDLDFLSTGFQPKSTATGINANGGTYVYVAIRSAP